MTPQEIIDMLSKLEEVAFYGMQNPEELPYIAYAQLHTDIKAALLHYHQIT